MANTFFIMLKDSGLGIAAILGLGFILWKVARWTKGVDESVTNTAKTIKRLEENVQHLTVRVDTLHDRVNELYARMDKLSDRVDKLYRLFTTFLDQQVDRATSPRSLTDYGEKLSQRIDAPSLATRYTDRLRGKVGAMNAWQIQELCFHHAQNEIMKDLQENDASLFDQITMCAYEEGIEPTKIMRVVGIVMRDILLKQTGQPSRPQGDPILPEGHSATSK